MFERFFSLFSHDLAIDLGTANTMVLVLGKGIVIKEPTIVAIHRKTKDILAIGEDAKMMVGKTPDSVVIVRPLHNGVISDFDTAQKMLSFFIKKVHESPSSFFKIPRPIVALGIPSGVTEVESKAVNDAARSAGASKAYLLEEPVAAALGADLPVTEARGSIIVDIGGGTCEIAVISLGGIVVSKSLKVAGYEMDHSIIEFSKRKYNLLLGERTAEEIKISIGSVYNPSKEKKYMVRGRDLKSGLPRSYTLSSFDIYEGLIDRIDYTIDQIKDTIEETPPELVADISRTGITLAGGGSMLGGFDKLLAKRTKLKVTLAKDPMTCVVRGCAKALGDAKLLSKVRLGDIR